jgi:ferredoxin-NADP reductase
VPDSSSLFKELRITRIIDETREARTFVLQPLHGWEPDYQPGQFLTLVFRTPHGEKRRSYSFSSAPGLGEPLSITVKKVENGEFSRYMLSHLKEGDVLRTSGTGGMFTLPERLSPGQEFCFLAAGSGIVPCYSLLKTLLATTAHKLTLIYSNRSPGDTIFYEALQSLEQQNSDRLKICFLFSNSDDIYRKRLSKWLLEQLMERYLPADLGRVFFYMCGPYEYMQMIGITLRRHTPKEQVIKESFDYFPRQMIPQPPDTARRQVTIRIQGKTYSFPVQYPVSVLTAATQHGLALPYSCEAGRCSSCVATCRSGKIWMAYNEVLSDREVDRGRILVCQSFPVDGDVEIDYEEP